MDGASSQDQKQATGNAAVTEPAVTATVAEPSAPVQSTADAIQARARKRKHEPNESAKQISTEPVWQIGHGIGPDSSIWWKDCNESLQTALETQYQASVPKVVHECITETGVKVRFRHDVGRWMQTNLSDGITRLLRRIELASPSPRSCSGQAAVESAVESVVVTGEAVDAAKATTFWERSNARHDEQKSTPEYLAKAEQAYLEGKKHFEECQNRYNRLAETSSSSRPCDTNLRMR